MKSCKYSLTPTLQAVEHRKKLNLISKYFLESGLSGIWCLTLNPAGSLPILGQSSSELRNQETKEFVLFPIRKNSMTLKDFLQDFVDVFHTLLSKSCFHGCTRSLDWGISSLDYSRKIRRRISTTS